MTNPATEKPEQEEGFTLIELMVVVLIMGILMAIAIPTFLGAKNSANAKAAQSNVRNSVTAEASYFTDNTTYGTGTQIQSYEPGIVYTVLSTWTSPVLNAVSVEPAPVPGATVLLGSKGGDGNCYWSFMSSGQVAYKYDSACAATSSTIGSPTFTPGTALPASSRASGGWAAGW